ncbi:MAG: hypothetical protein R2794_02100 [Chitinophagales bacterium]
MPELLPQLTFSELHYYPFGMVMPGRTWEAADGYRYGFNGQEQDDEISGNGNFNTAEFWEYDTRIGVRFNRDPYTLPYLSPYTVFEDNPIIFTDINGDYVTYIGSKKQQRKAEKLVKKAIKRDPNFAKIQEDRESETKEYIYIYRKGNSTSLNSYEPTTVPAGKNPDYDNTKPNLYWVEYGTIDPKYEYRNIVVTQWFSQNIEVQTGGKASDREEFTTTIPANKFDHWEPRKSQYYTNVNQSCGSTCSNVTLTASISASAYDMYSKSGDGSHFEVSNSGSVTYTVYWVAMSIPILVKAPKGNFNHKLKKGKVFLQDNSGEYEIKINRKDITGYYRVNIDIVPGALLQF